MNAVQRFVHRILGWHFKVQTTGFDGCSFEGRCLVCGARVLMDSQGNWFSIR